MSNATQTKSYPKAMNNVSLEKLYKADRYLNLLETYFAWGIVIGGFSLMGVIFAIGIVFVPRGNSMGEAITLYAASLVASVTAPVSIGLYLFSSTFEVRTRWKRALILIWIIAILLGFPAGTLLGILGIRAWHVGKPLFGPSRIDRDVLIDEYRTRKAA